MGRRLFEVSTTLPVAPEEVIDFLMDLTRHRGLHPFLASATVLDSGTSPEGPWSDWSVVERPRVGPLRYRIRFPVRMTRTSATSMTAEVRAPACRLRSTTVAHPLDGDSCGVVETTEVTASRVLIGYVTRNAEAAHTRTFSRLPDVLG